MDKARKHIESELNKVEQSNPAQFSADRITRAMVLADKIRRRLAVGETEQAALELIDLVDLLTQN